MALAANEKKTIGVIGAGSWGTALAITLSNKGHEVRITDLDQEMLARSQASRMRDITGAEAFQDDADDMDDERERRDLERNHNRERRREKSEDALERRKAELEHFRELRKIERARRRRTLAGDIKEWKAEEMAERARLEGVDGVDEPVVLAAPEVPDEADETSTPELIDGIVVEQTPEGSQERAE